MSPGFLALKEEQSEEKSAGTGGSRGVAILSPHFRHRPVFCILMVAVHLHWAHTHLCPDPPDTFYMSDHSSSVPELMRQGSSLRVAATVPDSGSP